MYEVIVLGATFAAAGIAHRYKEKCLVIERQPRAGYEFFGGESFNACGDLSVYPFLKESHTVFCAEICSVTQNEGYFICETHGVDGFRSYEAKYIIDTRCNSDMCMSKTYDMLIESSELPCFSNVTCEKTVGNNRYILHCSVPLSCGYSEARILIGKVVRSFSKSQRLILLADEFNYHVKEGYPKTENGILYLPSKTYETPLSAFNAGFSIVEEFDK